MPHTTEAGRPSALPGWGFAYSACFLEWSWIQHRLALGHGGYRDVQPAPVTLGPTMPRRRYLSGQLSLQESKAGAQESARWPRKGSYLVGNSGETGAQTPPPSINQGEWPSKTIGGRKVTTGLPCTGVSTGNWAEQAGVRSSLPEDSLPVSVPQ